MRVLVIGAGKMVEAVLMGLKDSLDLSEWCIYSPSGVSALKLSHQVGAKSVTNLSEVNPDWILLGCKPQHLKELSRFLGGQFKNCLHVSLLAALSEHDQCQILETTRLVRVMPNLAVKYKAGVSLLSSRSAKDELSFLEILFSKLGSVLRVEENELDELTLLTGSGPAFFYEFSHILATSFQSLTHEKREVLVRSVLLGAGIMAQGEKECLVELVKAVTSKGGVTEAVLGKWEKEHLGDILSMGIEAGHQRRAELKASLQN
jgi:pyrroline-5-carboxylate reductase